MRHVNSIYCVFCGKENSVKDKKCVHCGKKLNPKDCSFFDFLFRNGKSTLEDKLSESVFDFIKTFFINHLYGTVLAASVVFSLTSVLLTRMQDTITYIDEPITYNRQLVKNIIEEVEKEEEKQEVKEQNEEKEEVKEVISATKSCDNGYNLENDVCRRHYTVDATVHYSCATAGYQYNPTAGLCLSLAAEKTASLVCDLPDELQSQYAGYSPMSYVDKNTGKCMMTYQEGGEQKSMEIDSPIRQVVLCDVGKNYKFDTNCYYNEEATLQYSCSNGTLEGTVCSINETKSFFYSCPSGYHLIHQSKCEKE